MNKDEILKMSRSENEGRHDERELRAFGSASRVGMATGALLCTLLPFAGELLLNSPIIGLAGWLVYFGMYGVSNLVLFKELKDRRRLIWGIAELIAAVLFAVLLVGRSRV